MTSGDVPEALTPIWHTKASTARSGTRNVRPDPAVRSVRERRWVPGMYARDDSCYPFAVIYAVGGRISGGPDGRSRAGIVGALPDRP